MEDIRSTFPHDLTGHVARPDRNPVASGSYGDIYRGKLSMNGKSIDVRHSLLTVEKTKQLLGRNQGIQDRFHREIIVWVRLQHPNVLPLFGTIRETNVHYDIPAMVCPWVEHGALSGYLERNKGLTRLDIVLQVNDVAHGLQYLHSQHVVHGDLSGSNVLVRADGGAYIADFGLSTLLTAVVGPTFVTSRQDKGTVRWMAPELLDPDIPHTTPTTRSDVYSFGSIMLQILTGNIPYHRLSRDEQVIAAIMRGTRPDRSDQRAVTSSRWKFIERCWSANGPRPSSDEIVELTRRELTESNSSQSLV
ncbi:kinase-like protein [Imleria badia]|nr:kinase-like protein [Imleria badia]